MTALPQASSRAFEGGATLRRAAPVRRRTKQRKLSRVLEFRPLTRLSNRAFLMVVVGVLATGLALTLIVNTMLAQGSYERYELMLRKSDIVAEEQTAMSQLTQYVTPSALSERAIKLGMVSNANPAFIDLRTGEILGEPAPAEPRDPSRDVLGVDALEPTDDIGGEVAVGLRPMDATQ